MQQNLGPGTRLSEKLVCDRFGVSRMNVRRALMTLSNIGVVVLQAHKSAPDPTAKFATGDDFI